MTEIIICLVLLVLFLIFSFICVIKDEPIAAAWGAIFAVIFLVILIIDVKEYEQTKQEEEDTTISAIVYDITDLQIDTNTVVNGTDTTTNYTITYCN